MHRFLTQISRDNDEKDLRVTFSLSYELQKRASGMKPRTAYLLSTSTVPPLGQVDSDAATGCSLTSCQQLPNMIL